MSKPRKQRPSARERFIAKCEFMPASGCVLWRGGTTSSRDGTERTGVFWYRGKKVLARRWAAEHIHELDLMGKETTAFCGDPLCVQHVRADNLGFANTAQWYVMRDLGYCDFNPRAEKPDHTGVGFHARPEWLLSQSDEGNGVPF